jgi:glycerol-3-phosphate acyltransferase PlsY
MTDAPLAVIFAICAGLGYLLGSFSFARFLSKIGGFDVTKVGSGNPGATNMLRAGKPVLAALTLIGDSGKAAVATLVAYFVFAGGLPPELKAFPGLAAGGAAFLGHVWPLYYGFKGGKGVASFFGVLLAGIPYVGVFAGLTWLLMAFVFRFSSLAALTAAALAPIFAYVFHEPLWVVGFCIGIAVIIFWRHQSNIRNLISGQETRIGAKPASPTPEA